MFMSLHVPTLPLEEEREVITRLIGTQPPTQLLEAVASLRASTDASLRSLAECLSTRQLIRLCRKWSAYPKSSLYELLADATLIRFAPQLTAMAFNDSLASCGIEPVKEGQGPQPDLDMKVESETVTIGDVVIHRNLDHNAPAKIPSEFACVTF